MTSNITLLDKDKCTGCLSCNEVCKVKCISVTKDALGFLYPEVDTAKCIHCGLCYEQCPELTLLPRVLPRETYGALWKETQSLKGCSSGGIATALATFVVKNGGIYYGAVSEEDGNIRVRRIDSLDGIDSAKGSKYIQSSLEYVFPTIREDLKRNRVLFVGPPCQCAAIQNYCKECDDNLLLVSFPCGGWASTTTLQDEIRNLIGKKECKCVVMRHRRKVSIDVYDKESLICSSKANDSFFLMALDYKLSVRWSCWNCTYSCPERIGDIIIGDFWGSASDEIFTDQEIQDGISFYACLSDKGMEIINSVLMQFKTKETTYDKVMEKNPRLKKSVISDIHYDIKKRKKFEAIYNSVGLRRAVLSTVFVPYTFRKIRGIIKSILFKN